MISVKVNKADAQRIMSALSGLTQVVKTQGLETLPWKCAVDYYQLVMKNIQHRRAPSPGYSKRYRNWKYEYGWMGYPSPWKLKGDLVASLGAYKFGEGYLGGVQPGKMDSGGKSWFGKGKKGAKGPSKSIEMYGRVEESKRPVFEPTMKEYEKEGFQKRGDEMLKRMGAEWK